MKKKLIKWICTSAITFYALPGFSYYTFQDTGDLLAPDRYAVGAELQFRTSKGSGTNLMGRFEGSIDDEWNYRGYVGLGDVDVVVGGHAKWVPIPDYENQPAMGVTMGGLIASYESDTEFSARVTPFTSKSFEASFGQLTPYAALPVGVRTFDGETDSTLQLTLGSRFIHPEMLGAHYFGEVGFDLNNTFGYISFGATFPLNEENLIELWP